MRRYGQRDRNGGFALGSGGVFLVMESQARRSARREALARLSQVVSDRARRSDDGRIKASLDGLWDKLDVGSGNVAIVTGATGAEPATSEEKTFLQGRAGVPVRATASRFGHVMEAQFPLGLALAALSLSKGALFAPAAGEVASDAPPTQIVVVGAGHWRGEGMALVEAVN